MVAWLLLLLSSDSLCSPGRCAVVPCAVLAGTRSTAVDSGQKM